MVGPRSWGFHPSLGTVVCSTSFAGMLLTAGCNRACAAGTWSEYGAQNLCRNRSYASSYAPKAPCSLMVYTLAQSHGMVTPFRHMYVLYSSMQALRACLRVRLITAGHPAAVAQENSSQPRAQNPGCSCKIGFLQVCTQLPKRTHGVRTWEFPEIMGLKMDPK